MTLTGHKFLICNKSLL